MNLSLLLDVIEKGDINQQQGMLQFYQQNQYTALKLSMEIEETLAAQLQQQKKYPQSQINPQNSNSMTSHSFETQIGAIVDASDPRSNHSINPYHKKQQINKLGALNKSQQYTKKSKHSNSFSYTQQKSSRFNHGMIGRIDERQENPNSDYKELTLKLQSALNKINSKNEKISKQHGSEIINRFKKQEQKKTKEVVQKKQHAQQNKVKDLQEKPTINQNSEKIAREIKHKPIHLRLEELMAQKKKKIEQNEQLKKKMQEQQQLLFLQEYNKHAKKPEQVRSYVDYFNEMVRWKQKRANINKQKLQNQKSKELQGLTFTPSLNQKSMKMASSHQRLPIEKRGLMKKKEVDEFRKEKFKTQLKDT